MDLAGVSGHEWTKGNIARMYVRRGDARLGYIDLKTGGRVLERAAAMDDFEAYTTRWIVAHNRALASKGEKPLRLGAVALATPKAPAYDLAKNKPGEGVDLKAAQLATTISEAKRYTNRLVGKRSEDEAWQLGADGEATVAAELARLGPAWRTLHSVPVGNKGSDIDHVVIGMAGVFTVNAKNHSRSRILVNENYVSVSGNELPYARNSRFEAARTSALLTRACGFPVPVQGVVAIIAPAAKTVIKAQPKDGKVKILSHEHLAQYLSTRPAALTPEQAKVVYAKARNSTIWT